MRLLDSIDLGQRSAPNRVMFGPHETNLASGRAISDRHAAYYLARAEGGAGIIVTEEASVHPSDHPYERSPLAADCQDGWAKTVAACRPHGALVVAALGHAGGQGSSSFNQRPLWSPSDEAEVNTREVPKIMELEDIDAVVTGFGQAAALARGADVDGVEINAGQHSLVRQFMSGLTNRRDDAYGQDKLLLARQVLAEVRYNLGAERIIGLRLSCDEMAPWAGVTPEMALEIAAELAPLIDYLVVVRGSIFSVPDTRPTLHHGTGFNLDTVRDVGAGLSIPVFAQGSIVDVGQAQWALDDGRCDGVEMTRAQIADADLVAKLAAGTPERIRPCVLCNQLCKVRDNRNPIIGCITDPRAGHETIDPQVVEIDSPSGIRVLVVGGGPAGLEAARVAASAGHSVRLVEQSDALGGMAALSANAPGHARNAELVSWLVAECGRLGVEVVTGQAVSAADLQAWDGEVILATGGLHAPLPASIADQSTPEIPILPAAHILADLGKLPAEGQIAVWDPIGGATAVAVCEMLAEAGRSVVLCTPDAHAGNMLALSGDLAGSNVRLQQKGVQMQRRVRLRSIIGSTLHFTHAFTRTESSLEASALIDCGHRLPNDSLWSESGRRYARAGDAIAPRTIAEAIREGRELALKIGATR